MVEGDIFHDKGIAVTSNIGDLTEVEVIVWVGGRHGKERGIPGCAVGHGLDRLVRH